MEKMVNQSSDARLPSREMDQGEHVAPAGDTAQCRGMGRRNTLGFPLPPCVISCELVESKSQLAKKPEKYTLLPL